MGDGCGVRVGRVMVRLAASPGEERNDHGALGHCTIGQFADDPGWLDALTVSHRPMPVGLGRGGSGAASGRSSPGRLRRTRPQRRGAGFSELGRWAFGLVTSGDQRTRGRFGRGEIHRVWCSAAGGGRRDLATSGLLRVRGWRDCGLEREDGKAGSRADVRGELGRLGVRQAPRASARPSRPTGALRCACSST